MHQFNDISLQSSAWSRGAGWGSEHDEEYGKVFFKRAIGELPEMESSKAVAKRMHLKLKDNDSLLDVGCGVGHYLRSLKAMVQSSFDYFGVDLTESYINLAKKAFLEDPRVQFRIADIFKLPFKNKQFKHVMCNNVLLHLPSIATPIAELCRVAEESVLIRTLIGKRSFLIREVRNEGDEIDEQGEPIAFNYYNIYSENYVEKLIRSLPRVKALRIQEDKDFDPQNINASVQALPSAQNATRMCGEWQVNGYVMQPWCFIEIELSN